MAYEIPVLLATFIAAADLTEKQFFFVKLDGNGAVVLAANGQRAIGVLQNKPDDTEEAQVMMLGITKVVGGAAGTIPGLVASDANGKAVDAASTDQTLGEWLEAPSADLAVGTIFLTRNGIQP